MEVRRDEENWMSERRELERRRDIGRGGQEGGK